MFNSLKYAKILEKAGLPRDQAETHIQILSDVIGEEMATKDDIKSLKFDISKIKSNISRVESSVSKIESSMATKDDISRLESKTAYELQALEHRMTLKLGGLMAAFLATGLTAAKLLFI